MFLFKKWLKASEHIKFSGIEAVPATTNQIRGGESSTAEEGNQNLHRAQQDAKGMVSCH